MRTWGSECPFGPISAVVRRGRGCMVCPCDEVACSWAISSLKPKKGV